MHYRNHHYLKEGIIMNFLCVKYSGLKFNYIFETNDFIFFPKDKMERENINNVLIDEFFSCKYDESAHFYVLCKKQSISI